MFDSASNRARYEEARLQHDVLMSKMTPYALSYQRGYVGLDERPLDDHEHWRAGRENMRSGISHAKEPASDDAS